MVMSHLRFGIPSKLITTPMLVLVSSVVLGKRYGCYMRFIDATAVLEGRLIGFKLDVGCGLAREIRTGKRGAYTRNANLHNII